MKKNWWKGLAVIILLSVFLLGLLVPLNPGITSVQPFSIKTGERHTLTITGYNTFFSKANEINIWFKLDEQHAHKVESIEIISDNQISINVDIPEQLPVPSKVADVNLVISSDIDGSFVRPSALAIRQDIEPGDREESRLFWSSEIKDLANLSAYRFPFRNILSETIRNTYFHIPMWFGMILIFLAAFILSLKYLKKPDHDLDQKITSLISVGVLFGVLGLLTGAVWARYTWGEFWSGDIKQNMSLIALLIYSAYFVLRSSMKDNERRGRVSAAYSIFAFVTLIPLLFIIPRLQDSLHPGSGGNPALGGEDLDNTMRMIFYPAIIGWTLLGVWMAEIRYRILRLEWKQMENEMNG